MLDSENVQQRRRNPFRKSNGFESGPFPVLQALAIFAYLETNREYLAFYVRFRIPPASESVPM